jgi:tripartite-type tricarboxylate transporter receptor subunit TctC
VKSVKELITLARKRPGEITYASFGIGSYPHFATEALNAMVGMRMNHVPYKGSAPAATALLSGEVMVGLDAPQSTLPHLRSGRLRALQLPEIREPLQKAGFQVIGSTPEQFAQQVREDIARFTKIAREAGIKAE